MMEARELLVVDLDGLAYGLDAARVRETLWLPELSPADGMAPEVVGLFNLRGEILPVVDAGLCLGRPAHRCRASDQVVVLAAAGPPVALLVSEVRDLARLAPGALLEHPAAAPTEAGPLLAGSVQLGDGLVTVLDVRRLAAAAGRRSQAAVPGWAFCREAAPAEQALFRERARTYRQPLAVAEADHLALAVVELAGLCFAVDLRDVREFCRTGQLAPIPCCPAHVAGVFSLRGHLVILLEVAAVLKLPLPAAPRPLAVIGKRGEAAVGMAVDAILDVINPAAADLRPPPVEMARQHGTEVQAVTFYEGRLVALLDLHALLAREEWVVDEIVA